MNVHVMIYPTNPRLPEKKHYLFKKQADAKSNHEEDVFSSAKMI